MEITSEILFEEYAAVFEHAAHEIATSMGIEILEIRFIHGMSIGVSDSHLLKFNTTKGKGAVLILDEEMQNIPKWPTSDSISRRITKALVNLIH